MSAAPPSLSLPHCPSNFAQHAEHALASRGVRLSLTNLAKFAACNDDQDYWLNAPVGVSPVFNRGLSKFESRDAADTR